MAGPVVVTVAALTVAWVALGRKRAAMTAPGKELNSAEGKDLVPITDDRAGLVSGFAETNGGQVGVTAHPEGDADIHEPSVDPSTHSPSQPEGNIGGLAPVASVDPLPPPPRQTITLAGFGVRPEALKQMSMAQQAEVIAEVGDKTGAVW
jgi:hypothetical protein